MRTRTAVISAMVAVLVTAAPTSAASAAGNDPAQPRTATLAAEGLVGAGWQSFSFEGTGATVGPLELDSDGPVIVTVTDAFCRGDKFLVRADGATVGTTSAPERNPYGCGTDFDVDDPDVALRDATYSSGSWVLGSGADGLVIEAVETPWGAGRAFFRVDPAPTPHRAADCKRGGWRHLYSTTGDTFRNQGACVRSVAAHRGPRS